MIRYVNHNIIACTNVQTGEYVYCLKHWYHCDDHPETQGCREVGYFNSREEAEQHHAKMVKEGLK